MEEGRLRLPNRYRDSTIWKLGKVWYESDGADLKIHTTYAATFAWVDAGLTLIS